MCQPMMSIASLLYVCLSTSFPKALSSSHHFVSISDCKTNNDGNLICLIMAKAFFLIFLNKLGNFVLFEIYSRLHTD